MRKFLIENVQKMYPVELKEVNINSVLHYTQHKQKTIDLRFEQKLIQTMGFNFGKQYDGGINIEVLYKTFLEKQL